MQRLRISFLAFVIAVAALAQSASENPSEAVRRVGMRMQCQCGGCKDSVATCAMLECGFSKPAKERIARMQNVGMNDPQIVQAFVQDYGAGIFLAPPSAFGWIVPYVSVGFGILVICIVLTKIRKPRPLAEIGPIELDDPALAKYKDQIEKEMADLE